jgi:hypothetical protein
VSVCWHQVPQCQDQDAWWFLQCLVLPCPVISGLGQAPLVTWNRDQEPDVVQALLQDSSDKAYGKKGAVCGRVALPETGSSRGCGGGVLGCCEMWPLHSRFKDSNSCSNLTPAVAQPRAGKHGDHKPAELRECPLARPRAMTKPSSTSVGSPDCGHGL